MRVTTFVADHDALPADVAQQQLTLGAWPGVRYLIGGWQWMVDALASQAERRGATLHTRAAVRALERSGDRLDGAHRRPRARADAVVVAAGLPAAFAKLVEGARARPARPPTCQCSTSASRGRPTARSFALGIDEPTYYSKHSPPKHRTACS